MCVYKTFSFCKSLPLWDTVFCMTDFGQWGAVHWGGAEGIWEDADGGGAEEATSGGVRQPCPARSSGKTHNSSNTLSVCFTSYSHFYSKELLCLELSVIIFLEVGGSKVQTFTKIE